MDPGSILSQGTKIPETAGQGQRKKKRRNCLEDPHVLICFGRKFSHYWAKYLSLNEDKPNARFAGDWLISGVETRISRFQDCMLNCFGHVRLCGCKTAARQAPLSVGFPRQEYWSGLPFPPPGDLPDQGIEPASLTSPALAGRFFTTSATWETGIV